MRNDSIFAEQDENLLRENMECTSYDYELEVFNRGQSAHAYEDSARIEIPYSKLSSSAQQKLAELYKKETSELIPSGSVVCIGLNDEWGSSLAIQDNGFELAFLEHNQEDPVLCSLHTEACKANHDETLDYVARYRELNCEADKARVLEACGFSPALNEDFYDDACAELQQDFADRYGGAILHEYATYTEGCEILFEHRGCVLSAKDGKLLYKDTIEPKSGRIDKMFGETDDTPEMRKTRMDEAFNIAVKKEKLYHAMGLANNMAEDKGLATESETVAEDQFE